MAEGAYTVKDAYDGMELAVNQYLLETAKEAKHKYYDVLKKRNKETFKQSVELTPQGTQQDHSDYFELLDLIERVPEPYRTVFIKRELDGYEYPDIAGLFGETENWARVTFFRAKKKIQKLYTSYLEGRSK